MEPACRQAGVVTMLLSSFAASYQNIFFTFFLPVICKYLPALSARFGIFDF